MLLIVLSVLVATLHLVTSSKYVFYQGGDGFKGFSKRALGCTPNNESLYAFHFCALGGKVSKCHPLCSWQCFRRKCCERYFGVAPDSDGVTLYFKHALVVALSNGLRDGFCRGFQVCSSLCSKQQ